ncbi:MAG: metal-binding protein [Rhizobacter sp.]|nr:metal-binding protein [Chlorobiales bacterium]
MITHLSLGDSRFARLRKLHGLMAAGQITFGGNRKLKIYGTLDCKSGKRMKVQRRVFFVGETEAVQCGYRPCGHCLREKYQAWRRH